MGPCGTVGSPRAASLPTLASLDVLLDHGIHPHIHPQQLSKSVIGSGIQHGRHLEGCVCLPSQLAGKGEVVRAEPAWVLGKEEVRVGGHILSEFWSFPDPLSFPSTGSILLIAPRAEPGTSFQECG